MYEKVLPTENSSWRYWLYELDEIPFNWHYHPEYEICLTLNSRGQRYIGDNIHSYDVARFIDFFIETPRIAQVYNLGGGKENTCSVLEAFAIAESFS